MSPYFEQVKFPIQLDFDEFSRFDCGVNKLGYCVKDHSLFEPNLQELLLSLDLKIAHTALFHTPPYRILPIHSDIPMITNFAKLNLCCTAEGSRMFWYKLKPGYVPEPIVPDDSKKYRTPTGADASYVSIPSSETIFAASAKIYSTWVNASIAHSVINNTAERRWVISIPLRDVRDDHKITFEEGVERFRDLI